MSDHPLPPSRPQRPVKRSKKLIEPRIQLRFAALYLGIALIALLLQVTMVGWSIGRAARALPHDGGILMEELPAILRDNVLATVAVLLPISLVFGVLSVFRLVGPLDRFKAFLREVVAGTRSEACQIRTGDDLQELCELLNRATEPLRRERPADDGRKAA